MEADDRQLVEVVDILRDLLDDLVVAIYQYGSAIRGGLRPASDLDVFVVTDRPLSTDHRVALISELSKVSGRPVEVTVAQLSSLVPWQASPVREFQFGEWLRTDFENGYVSEQTVDHDLAPLVATVLARSEPIIGAPAADLLVPVPHNLLIDAMKAETPQLIVELRDDTTNVLLTLCRMLFTGATGEVASKDEAADWVLSNVDTPHSDQLIVARTIYLDGRSDSAGHDLVRAAELGHALASKVQKL